MDDAPPSIVHGQKPERFFDARSAAPCTID
jgi:hypothetical protein